MIRGHLRHLTLAALSESPLSGYDLMRVLSEKLGNKPSPGSIYPVLSELEEEGQISVSEEGRRKVYRLMPSGKKEVAKIRDQREQLVGRMEEGFKLCAALSGENQKFHTHLIESIRRGEVPFKEVHTESLRVRNALAELSQSGKLAKNRDAVRKILLDTAKRLESLGGVR